jgi:hypothetical protein
MLAIKWMDKHAVTVLTTAHEDTEVEVERRTRYAVGGRETVMKPTAVVELYKYSYTGGVDLADCCRTTALATIQSSGGGGYTLFLLDTAGVNSYILYTLQNPDKKRRLTHEQFRVVLATNLIPCCWCGAWRE